MNSGKEGVKYTYSKCESDQYKVPKQDKLTS